jgi:lysophospholipase L1-like esterase
VPARRPRPLRRSLAVGGVAIATLVATLATTSGATAAVVTHAFYLSIGASESVGVQPPPGGGHGRPTRHGYANYLVGISARDGIALSLTQLGCPGASTATVLLGGGSCDPGVSQLARAVTFLRSHTLQQGVVTVDLGFNNLTACAVSGGFASACVTQHLAVASSQLAQILDTLKAAAGPQVTFVGLNHENPFIVSNVITHAGDPYVDRTVTAMARLNSMLHAVYASRGVAVANVVHAFAGTNTQPTTLPGYGTVPTNVATVCALTWMCRSAPYGPNLHPNDAGYLTIARAIEAMLP